MDAIDIIRPRDIFLDVTATSKTALLKWLAQKAGAALERESTLIYEALSRREELGSTGVGDGIAMPHAPITGLDRPYGVVAKLEAPVAFNAIDERPIDIACLLLTPAHMAREHINVLACVARRLHDKGVQNRIRQAKTNAEIYDAIAGPI